MAGTSASAISGYDFEHFGLPQMILSSRDLRQVGGGSGSMEEAAGEIVDFFFRSFRVGGAGEPACALVRCFKTHRFGELPPNLRDVAAAALSGALPDEAMKCLTLLATRGTLPEWNSRHRSYAHRAIPFASVGMIERAPMIARLVEQVGLQPCDVLQATPRALAEMERRTLDVFHVEHAQGSPFVPAQSNFVDPHGIRSVLGFGGHIGGGELFFILLFSKVPISAATAALFRTLALGAKLVLLRHAGGLIFKE